MAIESVRPAAEAKRIELDVNTDISDAVMRGDGDRLQQVVWNLVANAVKFTPKDGVVKVRVRRLESDLELTVEDNGAGIAADFLPHVFDSFRQSDSSASRGHGGLGIGLSIAKHIVELHGGSITARSPGLGKGATFVVRLPISPLVSTTLGISRVPATMAHTFPAFATPVPPGLDGIRILVVDDEPDARELVGYVLESAGMEVRLAGSVAEALTELESFTPHVIVSDIGMPEEDGYSLIRRVRTLRGRRQAEHPGDRAHGVRAQRGPDARARRGLQPAHGQARRARGPPASGRRSRRADAPVNERVEHKDHKIRKDEDGSDTGRTSRAPPA